MRAAAAAAAAAGSRLLPEYGGPLRGDQHLSVRDGLLRLLVLPHTGTLSRTSGFTIQSCSFTELWGVVTDGGGEYVFLDSVYIYHCLLQQPRVVRCADVRALLVD